LLLDFALTPSPLQKEAYIRHKNTSFVVAFLLRLLPLPMLRLLIFMLLLGAPPGAYKPPMPFYDWGACPFEGCTYRKWKATAPVVVWTSRDHRQVAFTIKSDEWVQGLTGVVVTTKPGMIKVLAKMELGKDPQVAVAPGDVLYTLHYLGEGYELIWFRGKKYSDQLAGDPTPGPPPRDAEFQVISDPETVWWVKIQNAKGQTGWTNRTDRFTNMDIFGQNNLDHKSDFFDTWAKVPRNSAWDFGCGLLLRNINSVAEK
jgi:hypothetical protein